MTRQAQTGKQSRKPWQTPSLQQHGKAAALTRGPKGWGSPDGGGLEPGVHHPSL